MKTLQTYILEGLFGGSKHKAPKVYDGGFNGLKNTTIVYLLDNQKGNLNARVGTLDPVDEFQKEYINKRNEMEAEKAIAMIQIDDEAPIFTDFIERLTSFVIDCVENRKQFVIIFLNENDLHKFAAIIKYLF